ncbi:DUF3047 domain-containing protein [bacterium]|nr:DUF3047 domain-containing protein [bacterium]MDB4211428.1 DUF3047 domain-containing protein [Ascidiaceihabitans sp.]
MYQIQEKLRLFMLAASICSCSLAEAEQVTFSDNWTEQAFSLFSSNEFVLNADTLDISSEGTVSVLWKKLPPSMWEANQANWDWAVEVSVPATDLTVKGGDDRNLSIYFVFSPQEYLPKSKGKLTDLLKNKDVRVLMYVWGGDHDRGEVLPSPYLEDFGKTIILQRAGTGRASEQVNLANDFLRVFGENPEKLVGIAISADSDDTRSAIYSSISNLKIY